MAIGHILFDLDGTLLPMDLEQFTNAYFQLLAQKLAPCGYEPKALISAVWAGTKAMVRNDGSCTNEEAFWQTFSHILGKEVLNTKPLLEEFYTVDFQQVRSVCGFAQEAKQVIQLCKEKGLCTVLATNPIFPRIATESRARWAGLEPEDFAWITTYENAHYSKPNPEYYREILSNLGILPEACLMVGNDVDEDMIAKELGMRVFLLTDCVINKSGKDITPYPSGSFRELMDHIEKIHG